MIPTPESAPKRAWRRILYERQSYPDNYIDGTKFLDQLDTDTNFRPKLSSVELIIGASAIAQQLTVVTTFWTLYRYLIKMKLSATRLFLVDGITLALGLLAHAVFDDREKRTSVFDSVLNIFVFFVGLRISAPVLQTLTSSFSDDTIYALVLVLSYSHLQFHDYSFASITADHNRSTVTGALSLNAMMFTAVLLASRLKDISTVVSFVLLAVICFALFPEVAKLIRRRSTALHLVLTVVQYVIASMLLIRFDWTLFIVYQLLIVIVWLICPIWLWQMQRFKRSLRGPWEEAKVM